MIEYSNIGTICFDCAMKARFVQKNKIVGAWIGECDICNKQKPCTDLWHDWKPPKNNNKTKTNSGMDGRIKAD